MTRQKNINETLKDVRIMEKSWIAKIAAKKLGADNVAIVIGKTIYLHRVSSNDFLKNEKWLKHELCHVEQFRQYGLVFFMVKYLWETVKKGYRKNKFEVAAREAETL